ncbi:MAG: hypothetical protein L6V93_05245 [Clostridiales bacterium]|nr:MAG: hypothetical protein L6V93_05245 [Clostridiales bacterium]
MVLPCFAGINGVWGALTVSQITVTLAGAVLMMFRHQMIEPLMPKFRNG